MQDSPEIPEPLRTSSKNSATLTKPHLTKPTTKGFRFEPLAGSYLGLVNLSNKHTWRISAFRHYCRGQGNFTSPKYYINLLNVEWRFESFSIR